MARRLLRQAPPQRLRPEAPKDVERRADEAIAQNDAHDRLFRRVFDAGLAAVALLVLAALFTGRPSPASRLVLDCALGFTNTSQGCGLPRSSLQRYRAACGGRTLKLTRATRWRFSAEAPLYPARSSPPLCSVDAEGDAVVDEVLLNTAPGLFLDATFQSASFSFVLDAGGLLQLHADTFQIAGLHFDVHPNGPPSCACELKLL